MESKWWFVSEKFIDGRSKCQSPTSEVDSSKRFKNAEKLRITVEGAWIREANDRFLWKDSNDLIITSKIKYGNNPTVKKIHLFEKNAKKKTWFPIVFHPDIYATSDFKESTEEIAIEMLVYDVDGLSDREIEAISSKIDTVSSVASIAFPALLPYSPLASSVCKSLVKVVDNLNEHDRIIKGKLRLAINKPTDSAYNLLQPGFLICFAEPVNAINLHLKGDKKVYDKNNSKYNHYSYVVLRITKESSVSESFMINQRMATLLTELEEGKGKGPKEALNFLEDTLTSYTIMKKLKRYKELVDNSQRTEAENILFNEFNEDTELSEYI